jgi:hypothetical protein
MIDYGGLRFGGIIGFPDDYFETKPVPTLKRELDEIILDIESFNDFDLYVYRRSNENEKELIIKTHIDIQDEDDLLSIWIKDHDFVLAYEELLGKENFSKVRDLMDLDIVEINYDSPKISEIIITV